MERTQARKSSRMRSFFAKGRFGGQPKRQLAPEDVIDPSAVLNMEGALGTRPGNPICGLKT